MEDILTTKSYGGLNTVRPQVKWKFEIGGDFINTKADIGQ